MAGPVRLPKASFWLDQLPKCEWQVKHMYEVHDLRHGICRLPVSNWKDGGGKTQQATWDDLRLRVRVPERLVTGCATLLLRVPTLPSTDNPGQIGSEGEIVPRLLDRKSFGQDWRRPKGSWSGHHSGSTTPDGTKMSHVGSKSPPFNGFLRQRHRYRLSFLDVYGY